MNGKTSPQTDWFALPGIPRGYGWRPGATSSTPATKREFLHYGVRIGELLGATVYLVGIDRLDTVWLTDAEPDIDGCRMVSIYQALRPHRWHFDRGPGNGSQHYNAASWEDDDGDPLQNPVPNWTATRASLIWAAGRYLDDLGFDQFDHEDAIEQLLEAHRAIGKQPGFRGVGSETRELIYSGREIVGLS